MDNERGFPRALPRAGKDVSITFGDVVDAKKVFEPFRERWRAMKERAKLKQIHLEGATDTDREFGVLTDDYLKYSREAQQLRIEVTMAVRNEVLKVRRSTGLVDEDPKRGLADTWRAEGNAAREGVKEDGSSIRDT
jgi:monolysocardiolipin acyltransferase